MGHRTFLYCYKKYNRGSGRKRTNEPNEQYEPGVNSKCKTRSYVTLCIPVSIYRLTLAWISSENSTTHGECWLILTRLPSLLWTSSHPTGLTVVRCRLPCPSSVANCLLLNHFFQLSDWRSLPTSGHVEISSPNHLSGFAPKQTKGSSAWRTTYIVLHLYCCFVFKWGIIVENFISSFACCILITIIHNTTARVHIQIYTYIRKYY